MNGLPVSPKKPGSEESQVRTSCPVQNIGHLSHGAPLASCSHVLRYGFLTMSGRTGGLSVEAWIESPKSAPAATAAARNERIMLGRDAGTREV